MTSTGDRGGDSDTFMTAVIGFGCPYENFPRMFPELPACIVSKALGKLEDEGLLRMVHYGHLSWYTITRIRRRVV
jgi:hypothetical protein